MSPDFSAALRDADQCVKCGLCLPHCPTYRLSAHEADSPRGRIALTQALLTGALPAKGALTQHLDGCLSCRACEAVCPAKVPYGRVLDTARAALATPRRTALTQVLGVMLTHRALRAALRLLLWLARPLPRHWRQGLKVVRLRAVAAPAKARVALFAGCMGDVAERAVLADAQRLFAAAGVTVAIPPSQGCCGALHQHGGLPQAAAQRAARNAAAFADCDTVLPLASGCGAALRDLGAADGRSPALAPKVMDLCGALAEALDRQPLVFAPRPLRVGIHTACTQAHVLGAGGSIRRLLSRIPQVELIDLAPGSGCCGAAGTAFITQADQAARLLAPKLAAAEGMDVIVSANIGCSMHFAKGLQRQGKGIPVLHPVSLLAQALPAR